MPPSHIVPKFAEVRGAAVRAIKELPILPVYNKYWTHIVSLFMGFIAILSFLLFAFSNTRQDQPGRINVPMAWNKGFGEIVKWEFDHGLEYLETTRPLNIAHRGHSGAFPEETNEAYEMAILAGADVIECDACLTKDLKVVCAHESWINKSTDVSEVFTEDRSAEYFVPDKQGEGQLMHDFFTIDFTLEELKRLTKVEPRPYRDQNNNRLYKISTLEEMIQIAKSADRPVGIHVEVKDPVFVNNNSEPLKQSGKRFEDVVVELLHQNGYNKKSSPCFIQSFDEESLKYINSITTLPLILLIGYPGDVSKEHLKKVSEYLYGIGPDKRHLALLNKSSRYVVSHSNLVEISHGLGLRLHVYTFRNEHEFLAWNYRQDPYNEYADFFRLGIDGYFTDFPDTLDNFLNVVYSQRHSTTSSSNLLSFSSAFYLSLFAFAYNVALA